MRKVTRMLGGIGVMVKHSTNTIAKIGKTAFIVSENFSSNFEWLINKTYTPFSKI